MDGGIIFGADRVVILKQTLELWRAASLAWFGTDRFASRADDLFLGFALMIGTCEGRPMNATKLAEFAGLPRPTVVRKLARFQREGIAEKSGAGFVILPAFANHPDRVQVVALMRRKILEGAARLSKMDGLKVEA